ncbi:hypothetical protein Kpol_1018p179 [Vanderwaltozyma polyspora DSM 70294]|uniref:Exportin-T n=1 Tax=Vanderwaltozyma polyspora (strain ATCC 22028 / DSM 70294 / BCRC 21397 / CBS 2163 / NBRC 10782 / NRRL Y-8283 / UCD 57-17) TaxID=436907 RepID=XPOT_VANPO|nr:uncharacterized protein Kpol_1018p179 [Vanderwaltozyma polyspora DSM 70294]A7TE19.1 RecName: Full=Exportin-T; AltName: Full=Exportin(tRNA); AltName: Full=Karyopherin-beta; AltName: Full=tRNA exportin [Vanderwaltozyma polyspora DSM 70294]EDO19639.1 hypothetical protein Kpol_1018p179 [Vanderwaltozyma polyspora DSM 70294]
MLQRIREVVSLANNPATDAVTKKQALDYLEQMKSDPNAIQIFCSMLTDSGSDDLCIFVSLQILCDLVAMNTSVDLLFVKNSIVEFLRGKINRNIKDAEFLRNKISELITRLFINMYGEVNGNQWNTFYKDLIALLSIDSLLTGPSEHFSPLGLDYFARICIQINSEVADQTFLRSKDEQTKNNNLKDTMRLEDVQTLVTIWFNCLKSLIIQQQNFELAVIILSCIGAFISWVDITLIVNPEYINIIYGYLDYSDTKIACSQCLCEIISKKMKPVDKLTLLSMLNLTDKVASIGEDDIDVYEKLAKLASSVGLELSIILEQCNEGVQSNETLEVANAADQQVLNQVAPLVLKFMSHEYDSVTEQCFPFISQYLAILKKLFAIGGKPGTAVAINSKRQPLDEAHQNFLVSLLNVCFEKMKIDDSSESNSEEAIEEFNDIVRSKLKVFQDSIAVINPNIYLENISNHIQVSLAGTDWTVLELAIFQMHNLCESIRNNLFGLNKTEISTSAATQLMHKFMALLLQNSNLFQMDNRYVQILFFELVVRHYTFLGSDTKDAVSLLNIFCSEFGMFNKSEKVILRTWYLFTRFVKISKPHLSVSVLSQLVSKVMPLLVIKTVTPSVDGSEDCDTTFDSQLYIFEGVGMLIGANADNTYDILDQVLTPLFTDLERCISLQSQSPSIVLQSHHILMAIGTLARGTHMGLVPENQVNNALVNEKLIHRTLIEKFSNIAEVVLVTFSYFNKHETIRDASRFTFARLIPILNGGIVTFASKLVVLFLESDLKTMEMNDFLGFLGQMVHTFHGDENFYDLFDNLLTPVINKLHILLDHLESESNESNWYGEQNGRENNGNDVSGARTSKTVVVTDSYRDKILLKKAYYGFLQSFVTNNVTSLLLSNRNRSILPTILGDLLSYNPQEIQETSTMKLALNVLVNFIKFFGSGGCTDVNDVHASSIGKLDGLNEYFITRTIPLAFEIPFKPQYKFNINDGSCRVIACDLSRVLKEMYIQSGGGQDVNSNPALKYLTEVYFPQIQLPSELGMELIQMLITQDTKAFEKYYVTLINRLTS